jgi:hypothetical protein
MNVEHFAMVYALIAREAIQRFGIEGEKAVLDGIRQYGIAYGNQMAERTKADGRPNDFVGYLLYGEIDFSETGNEMQITQTTPHVEVVCGRCGWHDAWQRHGMLDMGRLYCQEIDSAILYGFNPDFKFEVRWHFARDHALYADFFKKKGDLEQAREKLQTAIDIFRRINADDWVTKYEAALAAL